MRFLVFLADQLGWVLGILATIFVVGIMGIAWMCPIGRCDTVGWLQGWVEFVALITTMVGTLAAWAQISRKPDLRFDITDPNGQPITILDVSFKPGRDANRELNVGLRNVSPEPARFLRIEVELQFDDQVPPALAFDPFQLVKLEPSFNSNVFTGEPSYEENTDKVRRRSHYAHENIIIYGKGDSQHICRCWIRIQGHAKAGVASDLPKYGLAKLHYVLCFRVFSDKLTVKEPRSPRIPLNIQIDTNEN